MKDLVKVDPNYLDVAGLPQATIAQYLAVDTGVGTLFVSTTKGGDRNGLAVLNAVMDSLGFSEPLRRSIAATTAMSGTKSWHEQGMQVSWHFHPEIGTNLSVIVEK